MGTRREFVKAMAVGGAAILSQSYYASILLGDDGKMLDNPAESRQGATSIGDFVVDNPYAEVRWENAQQITSTSHVHIETQAKLDRYYHEFGLRHIPISNYYPSAPTYPIKAIKLNQYRVEQDFGLVYNPDATKQGDQRWADGHFVDGPFRWNDLIMRGHDAWVQELPAELQGKLPFQVGDFIFKNVPEDIIVSPNAEHHNFTNSRLHANSLGSLYSSGNFDAHDVFKTQEHGYAIGTGLPWEVVFKKILDRLLFQDAGGVTINHPVWSDLPLEQAISMLDLDPRVLGIEVYNDSSEIFNGKGWSVDMWDEILRTGRKCLGFFVPDHTLARGRNILLVPSFTEHACLRAYRSGSFYGSLIGTELQFKRIAIHGNELEVVLNGPAVISFITNNGLVQTPIESVERQVYAVPVDANGNPAVSYVRIEVRDYTSTEKLFSQAIRFVRRTAEGA
jgi:hypothetical protein